MRRLLALTILVLLPVAPAGAGEFPVLAYHDITAQPGTDPHAVSLAAFRGQMAWLREHGYHTLSLRELGDIEAGRATLPERAVMLTFDDGLDSFAQRALPVLEEFGQQAVLSVVSGWLDGRQVPPEYAGRLLTWETLRRVSRSARVEILSHTDSLHYGIPANPQGNVAPATQTRRYDAGRMRYETENEFRQRLRSDLARSVTRLKQETGRAPVGIVWPYGYFDQAMAEEAAALGLRWQLGLGEEPARTGEFPRVSRVLLREAEGLAAFQAILGLEHRRRPIRFAVVDLDSMPNDSHAAREQWLSGLLARLQLLRVNAVLARPLTADGRQAYFANDRIPVRADVLYRVLHQLRTRAGADHLLLQIPPEPELLPVAAELARRHPYDGIVLESGHAPDTAAALARQFGYYRPGMRCGAVAGAELTACSDFQLIRTDTGRLPEAVRPAGTGLGQSIVLARPESVRDVGRTVSILRRLQKNGVRHFGIEDGQWLDDPAGLRAVAIELGRHVVTGVGY